MTCQSGLPAFGDRLIGAVVNGRTEYQGTAVETEFIPALEALGIRALGVVPEDRKLVSSTIDQIVEHLDGRYLEGSEYGERIIEHFLVGGDGAGQRHAVLRHSRGQGRDRSRRPSRTFRWRRCTLRHPA